ncbi:hypothetical protein LCGC14_0598880 [marine sediment metagenome]|uniref:YopX protein domain-containing protein n=1 Tax=marine sediment metagenome TaxID=412755 RepID=A0A0F9RBD0_9ZZZZ
MREIKFRGWHTVAKRMFSADEMAVDQLTLLPTGSFINVEGDSTRRSIIYPRDKFIPLQYTGLKDKNGVEIYEGDIVKTTVGKHIWWFLIATDSTFGGNNLYLITRYRNFRHINVGEDIEWGDFFVNECRDTLTEYNANEDLEVIGNIYENPDLLKELLFEA